MVDAGYPNRPGYLAPYKGERYHMPEWHRGTEPRTPKEKFNRKHSSIRNVIERSFWLIENEVANSLQDGELPHVEAKNGSGCLYGPPQLHS